MTLDDKDLAKLKFIRDEVKHEFNLLAMRSTILVTCQSFLVVPFAILNTAQNFLWVAVPAILICLLGIATTHLIKKPIATAHAMIAHWLVKQARLLADKDDDVYITERDKDAGKNSDNSYDSIHKESLAFSRKAPVAFLVFWCLALIWVLVRSAALVTTLSNDVYRSPAFNEKSEQSDLPKLPATPFLDDVLK
jgi:hypothetical protein